MTLLATVVLLGVLIFVHELGHFLAAKAVGIRVERFSIGLGPRLVGFQRGETDYVISWIPLGGYVKMGGMDDEVMERVEGGAPAGPRAPSDHDFDAKPIWARVLVISAGVIFNFIFAFLLYTVIAGFWGSQEIDSRRIGEVEATALPAGTEALTGLPSGAELVRIGDEPIGSWTDIPDALLAESGPTVFVTESPAATVEVDLPTNPEERLRIVAALPLWLPAAAGDVQAGSPAAQAGLENGDRVVAVEGVPVESWWDLVREVRDRAGEPTELEIDRGQGRTVLRTVTPEPFEETDPRTGETVTIGRIGVGSPGWSIPIRYERVGPAGAIRQGAVETVEVTGLLVGFLRDLVTGNVPASSVGSIGAIAEMSGQAARQGIVTFLDFMALFSINLAVLNLLPIPILDGGHLLFLLVEAVRGRALSVEQRARLSQVGLVIVMGLMLFALSNDIRRFFGL
ncbi:MAG: RIP metalloprotease RseP [Gemmatimonadota bacterium]|nr:RIP metalloprotease RseP [Gemmatimonadota bacterium]